MTMQKNIELPRPQSGARAFVSNLWRSNIIIIYLILSIACSYYASAEERTFLSLASIDGFTVQVTYVTLLLDSGNSLFDLEPLLWIHALRAGVANSFVAVEENIGIGFSAFLILMLFVPILRLFAGLRGGFLVFAIPLAAIVLSPRALLAMVAVAYLVVFIINGRAAFFLTLSFVFANLSSGTVLNNLIITALLARNHRPKSVGLYIYAILLSVSLFISAGEKYVGFVEQRAGYIGTVSGVSGIEAIISRSTIIVSLQEGDYIRFGAYLGLALLALLLLFFSARKREYRGYTVILLSALPSVLAEGLGFISLFVPVLLLMAGQQLPLRPERSNG